MGVTLGMEVRCVPRSIRGGHSHTETTPLPSPSPPQTKKKMTKACAGGCCFTSAYPRRRKKAQVRRVNCFTQNQEKYIHNCRPHKGNGTDNTREGKSVPAYITSCIILPANELRERSVIPVEFCSKNEAMLHSPCYSHYQQARYWLIPPNEVSQDRAM